MKSTMLYNMESSKTKAFIHHIKIFGHLLHNIYL